MTPADLLKSLSGPSAFAGAPFGADVITFCEALMKRGGIGVSVARDDRLAQAARRYEYRKWPATTWPGLSPAFVGT